MMAAMLASSSRCVPRSFQFISKLKHLRIAAANAKIDNHVRQLGYFSPLVTETLETPSINFRCKSRSAFWVRQHQQQFSVRQLHLTSIKNQIEIVSTPPFADSVTEGDVRWDKAVGDYVEEDEVIGEIETDKTAIEVKSPVAGVIEEILVAEGTVMAGQQLVKIKVTGEKPAGTAEGAPPSPQAAPPAAEAEAPPPPPTPSTDAGPIPTTPPPLPPLPDKPISSKPVDTIKPTPVQSAAPTVSASAPVGTRAENRVKMSRMRLRIAQRLKDAQNTCAMLTTFNEVDMSNIMDLRSKYKDAFQKKHNMKLGFMSAFIKASATALQASPEVNAVIDDQEIVYRDYVDISVAVATPKGLVVPVVRNCETMNFVEIERSLNELGEKARLGNLAVEDMDGGTFTISNGGVFGSMMGTPIINPPQSAILGMHGIFDRPVAVNGKVEIRPMMYIALTYDHRLIDGREGVTFLRKIKSAVEDPRVLFLDL